LRIFLDPSYRWGKFGYEGVEQPVERTVRLAESFFSTFSAGQFFLEIAMTSVDVNEPALFVGL
jgi:hypothetical protein